jgi:hypothetical protein
VTESQEKRLVWSKWHAAARAKRKADGKCHDCAGLAIPGTARCGPCTLRNRERSRGYDRRRLIHAWRPIDRALGTDE